MTTTVPALAQDIGLARQADYFLMKDQLTEDEPGLLHRVRKFAETEVLPASTRTGSTCRPATGSLRLVRRRRSA